MLENHETILERQRVCFLTWVDVFSFKTIGEFVITFNYIKHITKSGGKMFCF